MEEAVCAGADGLVAIYATRADDADGRLLLLHHAALDGAGVGAQYHVGVSLDEEGVLHVACRMVIGEVHGAEHVPVVLHLRTVGQAETQSGEDVDNLVAYDGDGVACAQRGGVGCAGEVGHLLGGLLFIEFVAQGVDMVLRSGLEIVDSHAELSLAFGGNLAKLAHQLGDEALLAEVFDAQFLQLGGGGGLQLLYFFQQRRYVVDKCHSLVWYFAYSLQK